MHLNDLAAAWAAGLDDAAPGVEYRVVDNEPLTLRSPTKQSGRGIFHSVPDLIDAIQAYLAAHNNNPQPFQWTATTEQILEKARRGRVTLNANTN